MRAFIVKVVVAGVLLGIVQAVVRAASFSVSPLQITLTTRTTSVLLTIKNEADREIRFEVSAFKWAQDDHGEMQLTPAGDQITFFPRLLIVAPNASRSIRVGANTSAFGAAEGTYRIFVEELPDASAAATANAVAIRTRLGIPLFLSPARVASSAAIAAVAFEDGRLRAQVRNTGNVHTVVNTVTWRGLDSGGATRFERSLNGWYLLAGDTRSFEQPMTGSECAGAETLVATVELQGGTLQARAPIPAAVCPGTQAR